MTKLEDCDRIYFFADEEGGAPFKNSEQFCGYPAKDPCNIDSDSVKNLIWIFSKK